MSVLRSIGAELMKFTTVRSTAILAIVLVLYMAAAGGGFAAVLGIATDGAPELTGGFSAAPFIYSLGSSIGYVFPVIVGALAVTGEMRFQTLTPTFLATPRRSVVLTGKLISAAIVGAVFGVIALVGAVAPGALILNGFGLETELGSSDTWALFGRLLLAMTLWALVGVGLGTLIPNQVIVIVVVLAFTQFVEPTLRFAAMFADWAADLGRFLPGAASDSLVGASVFNALGSGVTEPLEHWQGGLVLLAVATVLLLIGSVTTWRRDVT